MRKLNMKVVGVVFGVMSFAVGGVAGGLIAGAQSAPTPEVDRANATIQLSGNLRPVSCVGEDTITYVTYFGTWKGGESQIVPDPTDYSLSGPLTVSGIAWTINTSTGRGVLTAKATLGTTGTTPNYSGKLILVTQGLPAAGASVPGRGWINAAFQLPDEAVSPGDDNLIANVEFSITPTGAMGQFGDLPGSLGIPDFSAVTNVAPMALDGVC